MKVGKDLDEHKETNSMWSIPVSYTPILKALADMLHDL